MTGRVFWRGGATCSLFTTTTATTTGLFRGRTGAAPSYHKGGKAGWTWIPTIHYYHSIKMARPYPRVVVTDLDGTLLDPSHNVTRRAAEALALAQRQPYPHPSLLVSSNGESIDDDDKTKGPTSNAPLSSAATRLLQPHIQVMIASGRSPRSVQKVVDQLHGLVVPDAVLCLNGSLAYNPVSRAVSFPQFIAHDALVRAVRTLRRHIVQDCSSTSISPSPSSSPLADQQVPDKALNPAVAKDDPTMRAQPQPSSSSSSSSSSSTTTLPADQRPGFSCEVIWDDQDLEHPPTRSDGEHDPTTFVCDRVWEAHRRHTIYYDYMGVDCMQTFVESLRTGPRKGRVLKLLVLDRTRTAGELYASLPDVVCRRQDDQNGRGLHCSNSDKEQEEQQAQEEMALSDLLAITYSGPSFIEITRAGVHKGLGLQSYCEGYGVDRHDVVAFGDWLNDYEMLTYAGLGCVMGNGHPDLLRLAQQEPGASSADGGGVVHPVDGRKNRMRVIGSNADDGLAAEIESWFS